MHGTHHDNYLNGDYEGKVGRVLGAAKVADGFEQTVMIEFEDGTSRPVLMRYVVPVEPDKLSQQVLVIGDPPKVGGPPKGTVASVVGSPDSDWVVVSKVGQTSIVEAAKHLLVVLY